MQVKAVIKKIFYNENDFMTGLIKPDKDCEIPTAVKRSSNDGCYKFKGNHLLGTGNLENMRVELTGEWENDSKYGWGLACSMVNITDTSDLFFFLVSFISGVGPAKASALIKDFGNDNLVDMIENRPNELSEVKGIGQTLKRRIIKSWIKFASIREISAILQPAGCSANMVHKVCKHFADDEDVIDKVKDNIFVLLKVPGMSFRVCDSIALKSGMAKDDPKRVKAAITYCLNQIGSRHGHTVILIDDLFVFFKEELQIDLPVATWHVSLKSLIKEHEVIVLEKKYVALMRFYKAELFIKNFINERATLGAPEAVKSENLGNFISGLEKEQGFEFNAEQRGAIIRANDHLILAITGIAGAGKTTVAKGVMRVLENIFPSGAFCVTALSGIATDRIRKLTGYEGATIQSLLVKYKELEYIPYEVIVVDESSMISSELMYKLLKKIAPNCRVIFIGDIEQLDPIGSGGPFSDIINHAPIRITSLTEPNRTSSDSSINIIANDVRQGLFPKGLYDKSKDFQMIDHVIPDFFNFRRSATEQQLVDAKGKVVDEIRDEVVNFFKQHKDSIDALLANGDYQGYLYNYQVISPKKVGLLGTQSLNQLIQNYLNPHSSEVVGNDSNFIGKGDKVVHVSNVDMPCMTVAEFNKNPKDYDEDETIRVFNGFLGIVQLVDVEEGLMWVYFPTDEQVVVYDFNDVRLLLQLAYSLTVHKCQGSEFNYVFMPIHLTFYNMLSSRLLYTGLTRAKLQISVAGDPYAIKVAVKNKDTSNRETLLQKMFRRQNNRTT